MFTSTLSLLHEHTDQATSEALFKRFIQDVGTPDEFWLEDPVVEVMDRLSEQRLGVLRGLFADLSWYEGAEIQALVLTGASREQALGTAYDMLWLDISIPDERHPNLPAPRLRDVRQEAVRLLIGEDVQLRADVRDELVLFVTVRCATDRAPELYVAGPAPRGEGEQSARGVHVRRLTFHRLVGLPTTERKLALTRALDQLNPLRQDTPQSWQRAFSHSFTTLDAVRAHLRRELKEVLLELMQLLDLARGGAGATGEDDRATLRALREAATLLIFRLMFLLEVERRNLLYTHTTMSGRRALAELLTDASVGDQRAPGELLARMRALTAAVRGDVLDGVDEVAIRGASIFSDRPNDGFGEQELTPWLRPFEAMDLARLDEATLARWDRALTRAGTVATGQLEDFHLSSDRMGAGAEAHAHRILGDVYEQILALEPGRDASGAITLTYDGQDEQSATGAHYTPPELVEEIVRPALGHLFEQAWLAVEHDPDAYHERVSALRVCDPAMGSGHFLTVAALEIARELAWVEQHRRPRPFAWHEPMLHPNPIGDDHSGVDPLNREDDSDFAALVPPIYGGEHDGAAFQARVRALLPQVVQRCIYGVDVNPLACELGKLSLWLFTLTSGTLDDTTRPELTFLDGNLRCGNSLVSLTLDEARAILADRLGASLPDHQLDLLTGASALSRVLADVDTYQRQLRKPLDDLRATADYYRGVLGDMDPMLAYGAALREAFHKASVERLNRVRWIHDLATLAELHSVSSRNSASARASRAALITALNAHGATLDVSPDADHWQPLLNAPLDTDDAGIQRTRAAIERAAADLPTPGAPQRALHWEIAFPSVFPMTTAEGTTRGFDAIVANPPFVGDRRLRGAIGGEVLGLISARYMDGAVGDLCGFFALLMDRITSPSGVASTIGPNTLAQASNRRYALVPLVTGDTPRFHILRARENETWPGPAAVHICTILLTRTLPAQPTYRRFIQRQVLAAAEQISISSYLDLYPETTYQKLPSMSDGVCYTGHFLRGEYFLHVQEDESIAQAIARIPEAEHTSLFVYLNNRELQQQPRPIPSRIAIDFYDDLEAAGLADATPAAQFSWLQQHRPTLLQQLETPAPGSEQSVRIYREALPYRGDNVTHVDRWWQFGRPRVELRSRWQNLSSVTAFGAVSKVWSPSFLPMREESTGLGLCPSHQLFISPIQQRAFFAALQSFLFEMHMRREASTLKGDMRVTPTDSIPVFPLPWKPTWDVEEGRPFITQVPAATERTLGDVVDRLLAHRQAMLDTPQAHGVPDREVTSQWGPTQLYNLYDDPEHTFEAIEQLRALHHELLDEVLRAYGWDDLIGTITWGFERPWIDRTIRHVPDLATRAALFDRLGQLNQKRYDEELRLYIPHVVEALEVGKPYTIGTAKTCVKEAGITISDEDLQEVLRIASHGNRQTHRLHRVVHRGGEAWERR